MLLERPIKKSAQKALEEKQTATMSLTKVWLCNDYFQSEQFSVKCSIWWACKQTDSPASDQRQVTVKNLHRSFRNREAIYFRTREDYNRNFLDGLERRKLQKKVQISHLFDGRHFFSWRGSGLEKSLASVSQPITITGFPSLLTETQNVFSLDCLYLRLIWRLGSVYTGPDKFLQEQKLAQFYFAFTRERRNWTNFWTAKSQTCTSKTWSAVNSNKQDFDELLTWARDMVTWNW